ncbi:uncharacterized protein LOC135168409 [Diachasmimorpha longicaudata]|uniref:uncharacterized protein LOC135168409 n=1 Tax=Diachasmimorpha longicaudata TaxID=58733 RepID=UPI0030B8762A
MDRPSQAWKEIEWMLRVARQKMEIEEWYWKRQVNNTTTTEPQPTPSSSLHPLSLRVSTSPIHDEVDPLDTPLPPMTTTLTASSDDEDDPLKIPLLPSTTPSITSQSPLDSKPEIEPIPPESNSPSPWSPSPKTSLFSLTLQQKHIPLTSQPQDQDPPPTVPSSYITPRPTPSPSHSIPPLMSLYIPRPTSLPYNPNSAPKVIRRPSGGPRTSAIPTYSPLLFSGCRKCNGNHLAKDCPVEKRRCFFCGRWGADVRTCPNCRRLP